MADTTFQDIAFVKVDFTPKPSFELNFAGLKGHEELGKPFFYEVQLMSSSMVTDVTSIVGSKGLLTLNKSDKSTPNYLHGIVTRVLSEGTASGGYHYTIELRPWLSLLSHVQDCMIFQNKAPFDIITQVYRDAGFSDFEDNRRSSSGSTVRDYVVQYRESTYDFTMRLMEEYGIYYYFKHASDKHTLVFADDPGSHDAVSASIPFQFDQTEYRTAQDHVWDWTSEAVLHSGKFTYRDYNFTTPSADMTAKTLNPATYSDYKDLEVYDYPGIYDAASDGNTLTDVRMQSIAWQRELSHGHTNGRELRSGWKFTLEKSPTKSMNREYLIWKSELSMSSVEGLSADRSSQDGEGSSESMDSFRVKLTAIPGDTPFRLPRSTRRPMIRGPQTAKVMGASGDEICTDQYGRVKVKFFWDRSDGEDDTKTCWIRVAQGMGGVGWGNIFIPRVGMEVIVEFLEGNPDRPLITGVVYNATQTVPYALPDNKTRSTMKSNSSTGGNGFNEFRFEDKAGSEEVFFQAQKDYTKKVLNNETVTVHVDSVTTIETGKHSLTVSQGDHSLTVSQGNHSSTISQGNHSTSVSAGNHKLDVTAGKSDISAAQAINLVVGGTSIKITPDGIEITAPKITLSATASLSLSGLSISASGTASVSISAPAIALN